MSLPIPLLPPYPSSSSSPFARSLLARFSPRANEFCLAVAVSHQQLTAQSQSQSQSQSVPEPDKHPKKSKGWTSHDRLIWLADHSALPAHMDSLILTTYPYFTSLQRISPPSPTPLSPTSAPSAEHVSYLARLLALYRSNLASHIASLDPAQVSVGQRGKYHAQAAILHLLAVLYFPSDGRGNAIVTEELLDWLNTIDPAPPTEEGLRLLSLEKPYREAAFWQYTTQALLRGFFSTASVALSALKAHPDQALAGITGQVAALIESCPRSTAFAHEHDFSIAFREHRIKVVDLQAKLQISLENTPSEEGEVADLMGQLVTVLDIFLGKPQAILAAAEDWREALVAWSLFVRPTARRDDLPDTLRIVLDEISRDPTRTDQDIQVHLISGDVVKAITTMVPYSLYLACHACDLLTKLGLFVNEDSDAMAGMHPQTLRDYLLFAYTDLLSSNESFWGIALDYLATAGPEGAGRLRKLILHVPLNLEHGDPSRLHSLLTLCDEYRLSAEKEAISKCAISKLSARDMDASALHQCLTLAQDLSTAVSSNRLAKALLSRILRSSHKSMIDLLAGPSAELCSTSRNSQLNFISHLVHYLDLKHHTVSSSEPLAALYQILISEAAPRSWWPTLLCECVEYLDSKESSAILGEVELHELLRLLQASQQDVEHTPEVQRIFDAFQTCHYDSIDADGPRSTLTDKLAILQLRLAQLISNRWLRKE